MMERGAITATSAIAAVTAVTAVASFATVTALTIRLCGGTTATPVEPGKISEKRYHHEPA